MDSIKFFETEYLVIETRIYQSYCSKWKPKCSEI